MSFRTKSVVLVLLALMLVACPEAGGDSKGKESESSSAKTKGTKKKSKKAGSGVAAPSGDRLPIAVGQWTRHKVKTKAGVGSMTYSITGEEAGAHWLRFDYQVGTTKMSVDTLVDFGDLKEFRKADIRKAKVKLPTGQEQVVEGALLNRVKEKFADALGTFAAMHDDKAPREDVTVPAATFNGCYRSEDKVTAFGISSESTAWRHKAVPLTTMVKMVTKDGDVWELEGYGLKGGPPK